MSEEMYARLSDILTVREVRFSITVPGCRSESIIVATTLCDAEEYCKSDIADLYHTRWHAELDIRAIKQTLPTKPSTSWNEGACMKVQVQSPSVEWEMSMIPLASRDL